MRNSSRELTFRVKGLKGCATEKLRERLPAMEQEDVSRGINDEGESERERERERERGNLPNSGLIFIPIIIAVIARTAREGGESEI